MTCECLLEVIDLWKKYDKLYAVKGVSLSVAEGEVHGLLGPNGSGKTTTIKCIVGLLKPDRGVVRVGGYDATRSMEYKRLIGYLPENPSLPEYLTVKEFLYFAGKLKGVNGFKLERNVSEMIDAYELAKFSDKLIFELSKGTRQRVAVAAAFMGNPLILIFDEPFNGLDPEAQKTTKDYLMATVEEHGAVLMSTHILDSAEKICHSATIILDGETMFTGRLGRLKEEIGLDNNASLEEVFLKMVSRRGSRNLVL